MEKEDVVYIHNGILHSHKKEWNNAIYSNMGVPGDYHTKWSKSDRERQIDDITYTWNLKRWYKWTYLQRETDSQTPKANLHLPKGKGEGKGIN